MALTIEQAQAAGDIAAKIKARQDRLVLINQAIAEKWQVSRFNAAPVDGGEHELIIDRLDADTSAQALQFALEIYKGQLDALNAQLANI